MTYILEIGDRRRLKAGISVLHHTGHRAPCSGGRLNFAEARRATSAQPSPSRHAVIQEREGEGDGPPVLQALPEGQSVRELLHQPHPPPVIRRQAAPAMPTEAGQAAPPGSRSRVPASSA